MADVVLTRLEPPANEQPLRDDGGAHTQPWIDYHQSIADRVNVIANTMQMRRGVTDGAEAPAGQVGEFISVSVPIGSAITMGTYTSINVAQIDLSPGDWDVWGSVVFQPTATTSIQNVTAWISPTSATLPGGAEIEGYVSIRTQFIIGTHQVLAVGRVRVLNTTTRTMYLSALSGFTVSTMVAHGALFARRQR